MNNYDPSAYAWRGTPTPPRKKKSVKVVVILVVAIAVLLPFSFFAWAGVGSVLEANRTRAPLAAVKTFATTDQAFLALCETEEPAYEFGSCTEKDGVFRVRATVGEDEWTFFAEKKDGEWKVTRYQRPMIEKHEVQE